MSQWAEIRHLHLVEGVPKKEIARRLQLNIKTVRRTVDPPAPPGRVSAGRVSAGRASSLDPWREQIKQWLREDRRRSTSYATPRSQMCVEKTGMPDGGRASDGYRQLTKRSHRVGGTLAESSMSCS